MLNPRSLGLLACLFASLMGSLTLNQAYAIHEDRIMSAVRHGTGAQIEGWVQLGADINWIDETGNTPMMVAIELDSLEKVKLLFRLGASLEKREHVPVTPYEYAKGLARTQIVEYLEDLEKASCPTCFQLLPLHRNGVIQTPCEHEFHESCLSIWRARHAGRTAYPCPVCRHSLARNMKELNDDATTSHRQRLVYPPISDTDPLYPTLETREGDLLQRSVYYWRGVTDPAVIEALGTEARRAPDDSFILGSPWVVAGSNLLLEVTYEEAEAWCAQAGAQLPTEEMFQKLLFWFKGGSDIGQYHPVEVAVPLLETSESLFWTQTPSQTFSSSLVKYFDGRRSRATFSDMNRRREKISVRCALVP